MSDENWAVSSEVKTLDQKSSPLPKLILPRVLDCAQEDGPGDVLHADGGWGKPELAKHAYRVCKRRRAACFYKYALAQRHQLVCLFRS